MHGFAERGGEPPPPHEDERIFAEERWFSVDRQADAYVELLKATSRAQYCSLIRRSRKIDFCPYSPECVEKEFSEAHGKSRTL
jgi:hypothetical protein